MKGSVLSPQFAGEAKEAPIRRMNTWGNKLKKQYGEDAVSDFSIGNPDVPGPSILKDALLALAQEAEKPFAFGYTPAIGIPEINALLAKYLTEEQGTLVATEDVMTTCGAGSVSYCILRVCLERGDNVVGTAPFFTPYVQWAENFGGTYKPVMVNPDFSFNLPGMEKAIDKKTRVVIFNSPHNPTGYIYKKKEIEGLVAVVRKKSEEYGRPILIISDEPYRFLAFGGAVVTSVLPMYEYSCVVSSFAKNMSLPGERVGYLAVANNMPDKAKFVMAVANASGNLGMTNAPIIGQKLLKYALGKNSDVSIYEKRRDVMADVLKRAGYEFNMPEGAFYFFPKAPGGDCEAFCDVLAEQRVMGVNGKAFGMPGYFRLAFCVNEDVIKRAYEGFKKAREIMESKKK